MGKEFFKTEENCGQTFPIDQFTNLYNKIICNIALLSL